jgi:hypothetical protein
MTDTYAIGIHEKNADTTLWVKVGAPDNETIFKSVAITLKYNLEDFSVADILNSLKSEFELQGIYLQDDAPTVQHSPHLYDHGDNTVSILDKDTGDTNVTFGVDRWAARYGVIILTDSNGIPVH